MLDKPGDMFDRDVEWMELTAFASDDRAGATLGVVSGRHREGKTFLLRALCEQTGGFYFAADEATDGESLHPVGVALGAHLGLPSALRFESWHEAFDAAETELHALPRGLANTVRSRPGVR